MFQSVWFYFRLCGSPRDLMTRQFESDTNELLVAFRAEYSVPRNALTGQPLVNAPLVGFRATLSLGEHLPAVAPAASLRLDTNPLGLSQWMPCACLV